MADSVAKSFCITEHEFCEPYENTRARLQAMRPRIARRRQQKCGPSGRRWLCLLTSAQLENDLDRALDQGVGHHRSEQPDR